MPTGANVHVIAVDATDFTIILSDFSSLVHDKFYKSIPYKDYTKLKKNTYDIEFRFYPDDGCVLIIQPQIAGSLLYWGRRDDNSFGTFLWHHYEEELKEMMKDDSKYKYDLFGEYDNVSATQAISSAADKVTACNIKDTIGYYDYNACTAGTSSSISTKIQTDTEIQLEMLKQRVEELGQLVKDSSEEIRDRLARKVDWEEFDVGLADLHSELMDHLDEATYRTSEDLKDLEKKIKDNTSATAIIYDASGLPHQVPVDVRGTSSNCYPVKNYKIDIKADYMSACDNGKEKNNMDTNKMFNGFECGPVDDRIKMSPYGMAIRNADGRYVSYDAKNGNIMDVEVFNFDNHKLIWKMPVAVSAIAVGDTVIHMKKPMFVTSITDGITVIDIFNGEVKTIVPAQNMFGFNFVTKVVSLFNFTGDNTPTAENPFGNIMPFMLMGNENMDMKDFFMMMAVANGGNMNAMFQNPFMVYAMMNDNGDMKEMLPFMLWGQTGLFGQAPVQHQCNCGQHNGENH